MDEQLLLSVCAELNELVVHACVCTVDDTISGKRNMISVCLCKTLYPRTKNYFTVKRPNVCLGLFSKKVVRIHTKFPSLNKGSSRVCSREKDRVSNVDLAFRGTCLDSESEVNGYTRLQSRNSAVKPNLLIQKPKYSQSHSGLVGLSARNPSANKLL